ncbi:hypothetical protein Tco_0464929 [Tanacetum coccineum]
MSLRFCTRVILDKNASEKDFRRFIERASQKVLSLSTDWLSKANDDEQYSQPFSMLPYEVPRGETFSFSRHFSTMASQMRPPGFNQPNTQNNQNCYQGTNSNFNQNRGGNYNQNRPNNQTQNQNQVYQAPPYQPSTNQPLVNQTYTRASKGSASEDTSSRMDFSPIAVTPGGLTHSSANQDIPADIFVTPGNMPISTGSDTIPAGVSVPTGSSTFPAGSEQVPPVSNSVDKGKAQLAELERQQEELLWQDELLACQLDQDFDIPAQQEKRQQEVQTATMHYTDDDWITIMAKIQANEELSRTLIGSNLPEGDFASAMVEMVDRKRRQIAEQKAKARRDRPMSQAEQRDFMRTFVKNQNFTRASKRLGDELEQPSLKRPKPAEESEVVEEKVESSERTPRKRKSVARKGLHISKSTIPIETGDPDAEHKMCLKYASDEEDDSDCDTLVPFYAVVDWELLPTGHSRRFDDYIWQADGVGLILWGDLRVLIDSPEVDDGSEFWKSQHQWRIQSWKLYSFSGIHVLETVSGLVIYMFVDKKYPLTVTLMERMLDYQLEIGHGAVGN